MKIVKEKGHSLLIKPFGLQGRLYLACSVILFFDLKNTTELLSEQELWKTIPETLGQGSVLDMGMPKPRGEILATGKCFAPHGTKRPASEVSLRVGTLQKTLNVFGDRYWLGNGPLRRISDPQPFSEIPIAWENAFGGEGFSKNPRGKGVQPHQLADGRKLIPLPNIELPRCLIGSPDDRPEPAGFGPLDLMWPQRFEKQGTYDDRWLQQRWPFFPDDMNYELFNSAPDDQFLVDYFTGDETIEILNMHPEVQLISSRLPAVRIRCFVTKQKELKSAETVFEEVTTHIDTVWLFPELMRGLVIYRGITEILDDDYADVSRIYLVTEAKADEPKSLEHYAEAQRKALDFSRTENPTIPPKAQKKINDAMQRIRAIPREVEAAKLKAMGKAPIMPRSPAELAQKADGVLQKSRALLMRMESQAREMQEKFGGRANISLQVFGSSLQTSMERIGLRVRQASGELEETKTSNGDIQRQIAERIQKTISKKELEEHGMELNTIFPEKQPHSWQKSGFDFVVDCRRYLEQDAQSMNELALLGFSQKTVRRIWMGINPVERQEEKRLWGMVPKEGSGVEAGRLALPAGLVMPRFHEATLDAIYLWPGEIGEGSRKTTIEGSVQTPLFLPAIPRETTAPILVVPDELQARFLEQEVGDVCSVISLQNPNEQPNEEADSAIESAKALLVVLQADVPASDWSAWQKTFPRAEQLTLPVGDTVFMARQQGTDIRQWILDALSTNLPNMDSADSGARTEDPVKWSPIAGMSLPSLETKTMIAGIVSEVRTVLQSEFAPLLTTKSQLEDKFKNIILAAGKNPEQLISEAQQEQLPDFAEMGEKRAQKIAFLREEYKATGKLSSQSEQQMNEAETLVRKLGEDAQTRYESSMAKIDGGMKKISAAKAGELPAKTAERLQQFGLNPGQMKKRTREEVLEMYSRGESLAGAIISGIDLSGLDLPGIDLCQAQCRKTNFSGSNLEGADLRQVIAQQAIFSRAILKRAQLGKGLFNKTSCKGVDLSHSDLTQAIFKNAELSEANLSGSRLYMTILQKAKLHKAILTEVNAKLSVFSGADASGASFSGAHLIKCLFQRTLLDQADFTAAILGSTMFYGARGDEVIFKGADMSDCRMGGQTAFPGADFSKVIMNQGCFRDSNLAGAIFQGSRLNLAMLENCTLVGADFYRVSAIKTRFSKSDLEGADLRGINLFQGSLRKARLVNTDLRGSNLFAVDFYKAVMGNTQLDGANLKMTLIFEKTDFLS